MRFVLPPLPRTAIPVSGTDGFFPVGRVFCVGRNYADHAREMGGDPHKEPPFFFSKPGDAVVPLGGAVPYPQATSNLHHEVELVVALGGGGHDIAPDKALDLVWGYAVGIDLTRRDLQDSAKRAGRPWDMAKGFEASGPVGAITPAATTGALTSGAISLSVNGVPRQTGDLKDMIWPVSDVISFLSRLMVLRPGDLIFTGTPAGVGPVEEGDELRAEIAGLDPLTLTLVAGPVL
ncbi:fumarylacetoacetate hydrolase family protein [Rhodospirillum rubrum]|uniref:Fumarylacetoacetate (FAA) hydrolase n=1 Tax=Rhodospirillum rubrum (strain ATCC 11170 / ATH 1.1.1 / DSM 467 / LMG 4362 / NCIMB 8255 / S1) TaxID=269796 RepID=Q2RN04_RHORT|nr:fumarylacetoacetate hydrolase family protein [Rhodospirillum rubrum]ABC24491.1 Fumarylacetoacetate (FAA) hydrolase [Rhodospirillum rubrum ATCC 11170]AEO50242.1 fumarylacetoacetate (FAA) hydrolase [Rhodospirillum rubrum F11]MBK5956217.1 fumarylacetoacetate (FAA) hydrolase [Rhodospirillum rubrum]QXG80408.1 fumarylacetoacetate hydrolase family protein [Rhodospirillum rubrum]HCF19429.1 FAA hydrolase family protein [Rhodospirillum rubrum]